MKQYYLLSIFVFSLFSCGKVISFDDKEKFDRGVSIHHYDFVVNTIDNKPFEMKTLRGKKVMIVNLASWCGLTFQCESLEKIYKKYKDEGFVILGFPSNDFDQEFGDSKSIKVFYEKNYGISFPIMRKVRVTGDSISPVYDFLTHKSKNGLVENSVVWNYQKYLIDEYGYVTKVIAPKVLPDDNSIVEWIESPLKKKCRASALHEIDGMKGMCFKSKE